jgi:hypothetical protein
MNVLALIAGVAGLAAAPPHFSARVDNPWFPLRPGTTYVYVGVKDGKRARDVVTVTRRTKAVDGAPCVEIDDRLYLDGKLHERTTDWYSQDDHGNVWYFGEDTAELDANGHVVSTEGTWRSGRNGARAGVFMFAEPRVGRAAVQEHYKGHAEDHFRVVGLGARVQTPYITSTDALLTREWTPLEPGVVDRKVYVRGVGMVLERTLAGGDEHLKLVSVTRT